MNRLAVAVSFDVSLVLACAGLLAIPRAEHLALPSIETPSEVVTTMSVLPMREPVKHPGACSDRLDFKFAAGHIGADGIAEEVITRTFENGRAVREDWQRDDAPHRTLRIEYDSAGRRSREVLSLFEGRDVWIDSFRYDREGRLVEKVHDELDRDPYLTLYTYDARGRLVTKRENVHQRTGRGGSTTTYTYDGDLLRSERVNRVETTYVYWNGRVSAKHMHWIDTDRFDAPSDENITFVYDDAGRVTRETNASGFSWVSHYDAAGNLLVKEEVLPATMNDPTPLQRTVYTYDCF